MLNDFRAADQIEELGIILQITLRNKLFNRGILVLDSFLKAISIKLQVPGGHLDTLRSRIDSYYFPHADPGEALREYSGTAANVEGPHALEHFTLGPIVVLECKLL